MSSRREFVKGSALAATACLLPVSAGSNAYAEDGAVAAPASSHASSQASGQASSQAGSWYDRPMRWARDRKLRCGFRPIVASAAFICLSPRATCLIALTVTPFTWKRLRSACMKRLL